MKTENFVTQMNEMRFRDDIGDMQRVCKQVHGFSGPYVMKIINMAIANMEGDEYYLEIGTHQGRTLIGGMIGNEDKRAVAVDNFSQFGEGAKESLLENIDKFDLSDQIRGCVRSALQGSGK